MPDINQAREMHRSDRCVKYHMRQMPRVRTPLAAFFLARLQIGAYFEFSHFCSEMPKESDFKCSQNVACLARLQSQPSPDAARKQVRKRARGPFCT